MMIVNDIAYKIEAYAGSLTCGLSREEWVEHFVDDILSNAHAVVANDNTRTFFRET